MTRVHDAGMSVVGVVLLEERGEGNRHRDSKMCVQVATDQKPRAFKGRLLYY